MTKSTITREQQRQILIDTAQHIISRDNTSPYSENLREIARIALAAIDSEPYGYVNQGVYELTGSCAISNDHESYRDTKNYIPLYRHAQQPVVPEKIPDSVYQVIYHECGGFVDCDANAQAIWNACRAAMLAAAQQEVNQ